MGSVDKVLNKLLLLHLIYFKGLGGEVIGDGRGLLAGSDLDAALNGDDQVGAVKGVLTIHIVAVEGDGLGGGGARNTLKVQGDGLRGLGGVHDFHDHLTRLAVEDAGSEETVLSGLSGYGLLVHRQ